MSFASEKVKFKLKKLTSFAPSFFFHLQLEFGRIHRKNKKLIIKIHLNMKIRLTIVYLIAAMIFQSCSMDSGKSNTGSVKENATQIENETNRASGSGTYYINDLAYKTGDDFIKRYENDEFQYAFDIVGLNYKVREGKNAFFFENLNSEGEYIKIYNIEEHPEGFVVFDATTSEGGILEGIEYSGEGVAPCGVPCIIGGLEFLKSVLEYLKGGNNDPEDGEMGIPEACQAAVAAMAPYCDGYISYHLEDGWFGTECHVECHPD